MRFDSRLNAGAENRGFKGGGDQGKGVAVAACVGGSIDAQNPLESPYSAAFYRSSSEHIRGLKRACNPVLRGVLAVVLQVV